MGKKILLAIAQVIIALVLYEIGSVFWSIVCGFLGSLFKNLGGNRIAETITQTILPICVGLTVVLPMSFFFQKIRLVLGAYIAILAVLAFAFISQFITVIADYGLISFEVIIQVWVDVILGGIISVGLFQLCNYEISKKE